MEIAEKTPKAVRPSITEAGLAWWQYGSVAPPSGSWLHELLWGIRLSWELQQPRGEAPIASLALSEYALPSCEADESKYPACDKVKTENISDYRVRVSYSSHKSEYGEMVAITIHGPANVTFTHFNTGEHCGIVVGYYRYSGSSLPPVWNVNDGKDTIVWYCSWSENVTDISWIFEVDHAEDSKLHIDIPLGFVIPADATKLVLVSREADGCLEAPIRDFVPTLEIAESVDFWDMKECDGSFSKGNMTITRRLPLPKEDHEVQNFRYEFARSFENCERPLRRTELCRWRLTFADSMLSSCRISGCLPPMLLVRV